MRIISGIAIITFGIAIRWLFTMRPVVPVGYTIQILEIVFISLFILAFGAFITKHKIATIICGCIAAVTIFILINDFQAYHPRYEERPMRQY